MGVPAASAAAQLSDGPRGPVFPLKTAAVMRPPPLAAVGDAALRVAW